MCLQLGGFARQSADPACHESALLESREPLAGREPTGLRRIEVRDETDQMIPVATPALERLDHHRSRGEGDDFRVAAQTDGRNVEAWRISSTGTATRAASYSPLPEGYQSSHSEGSAVIDSKGRLLQVAWKESAPHAGGPPRDRTRSYDHTLSGCERHRRRRFGAPGPAFRASVADVALAGCPARRVRRPPRAASGRLPELMDR